MPVMPFSFPSWHMKILRGWLVNELERSSTKPWIPEHGSVKSNILNPFRLWKIIQVQTLLFQMCLNVLPDPGWKLPFTILLMTLSWPNMLPSQYKNIKSRLGTLTSFVVYLSCILIHWSKSQVWSFQTNESLYEKLHFLINNRPTKALVSPDGRFFIIIIFISSS